jgi:hypothetical protein
VDAAERRVTVHRAAVLTDMQQVKYMLLDRHMTAADMVQLVRLAAMHLAAV